MRNLNPSSKNGNVTTFCSGRRFFDVFSISWKFYRENFLHTTLIRNLLIKAHLLNYYMWYFWPRWQIRSFRRDATASRMTKYWNSLNRGKRSLIPPPINPETCRLVLDIASRTLLAFPRFLQTLCLKLTSGRWRDRCAARRSVHHSGGALYAQLLSQQRVAGQHQTARGILFLGK